MKILNILKGILRVIKIVLTHREREELKRIFPEKKALDEASEALQKK